MALSPNFLDELRARTPLPALVGRHVRLLRSGRQWKGCCPFHGEKTPSFYVYEDHYHCFGCGEHGDAITFITKRQGVSFMEAVEQLAAEAGMEVPKPSPAAAEAERRRLDLSGVLEAAERAYQRRLYLPEGARALDYLRRRSLTDETIRRFGLGWSGDGRGALAAELSREGIEPAMLLEAGLMRPVEEGRPASDMFFGRVMFPIRDRRGRVVSFGGRILGDGQPKYVNGPETALFSKRRTLFGLDLAREAARAGAALLVVEGYMDVIALHQWGFPGAIAPLGTALTEEQLQELWRLSPCPTLCFDGDAPGIHAAARAVELALPGLSAERSLKIAALPDGEDPDSLVRRLGAEAMQAVLAAARPLSEALFDMLREEVGDTTIELRASLSRRLEEAASRIQDRGLGWEYRKYFRASFHERYDQRRGAIPSRKLRTPPRSTPTPAHAAAEQARCLLAILLSHPGLLPEVEEAFGGLALPAPLDHLRAAMLAWSETAELLESTALLSHLSAIGLAMEVAQVLAASPGPLPQCAAPEAMPAEAKEGWWHFFHLTRRRQLDAEVAEAVHDFELRPDDAAAQHRLIRLRAEQDALSRGELELDLDQ